MAASVAPCANLLEEVGKLAREGRFDYLLIESTGISEPLPVAETFTFRDEQGQSLADLARPDTMVTVVDGVNFLRDFHEAESLASHGRNPWRGRRTLGHRAADRTGGVCRRHPDQQDRPDLRGRPRRADRHPRPAQHPRRDPADEHGRCRSTESSTPAVSISNAPPRRRAGSRKCAVSMCRKPRNTASPPPPTGAPAVPSTAFLQLPQPRVEQRPPAALKGFFWLATRPRKPAAGRRPVG